MSGRPSVSVVIPCFNDGKFLPEAVASVTDLRRDDVELVVVDDGSTDEHTLGALDRLRARGVCVLRQENRGLAAARNAGVRAARAELILPLDSDNRIREPYLTTAVSMLAEDPRAGIVYGDAEYFGERTGPWRVAEFDLVRLANGNFIDACALYRKTVWESVGGYDETMPAMGWEDWDFWLRAAQHGWGFRHLHTVAFDYRVRSGSMLATTNRHQEAILRHIFSKPENAAARSIRELSLQSALLRERARTVEESRDYRLGRAILDPIRWLVRLGSRRD